LDKKRRLLSVLSKKGVFVYTTSEEKHIKTTNLLKITLPLRQKQ